MASRIGGECSSGGGGIIFHLVRATLAADCSTAFIAENASDLRMVAALLASMVAGGMAIALRVA
jgi:hypothetical protein